MQNDNNMDLNYINNNLPDFELSYERVHHKKVPNLYIAIPYSKKYLLWFTYFDNENCCYLLEYNTIKRKVQNYKKVSVFFNRKLCYGSLLFGSIVTKNDVDYFCCENIYHYCGKNMTDVPFKIKLMKFRDLFENNMKALSYTGNELIVTLCIMDSNKEELIKKINDESYKIYGILCRNINNNTSYLLPFNRDIKGQKLMNFRVMAEIKHNVYSLYYYDVNKGIQFYQKTYIPDYKTSVMLNEKFRSIKEDSNLDLLEESDDDEEFENTNIDKFVFLDRYYNFKCYYHPKLKRFVPKEFTTEKKIANSKDLNGVI
jgi:hypothetical protein